MTPLQARARILDWMRDEIVTYHTTKTCTIDGMEIKARNTNTLRWELNGQPIKQDELYKVFSECNPK